MFCVGPRVPHCCVAVPVSRGWGANFPWLVYVLWARRGVGWGARPLAPRAGVRVCVWALGAPPAVRVAWVTPLQGASEAGRSPSSGCPPPGGCRGPLCTFCGRGCAVVGAQHCPLGLLALWELRAAGLAGGRPRGDGLPPLCGASGVKRCPSPGRSSSGAGSRGSVTRVSQLRLAWAWGPSTSPRACALVGRHCALWGWQENVPGGGCLPPL